MTLDPENIKAILATQFNDFGKGDEFHNAWSLVTTHPQITYLAPFRVVLRHITD
jgi:hypothetical protein